MRDLGQHRIRFTPALWAKWLNRLNTPPNMRLRQGIHEFRSLLASHEMKRRARE